MRRKTVWNVLFYGFAALLCVGVVGGIVYMFQAGRGSLPNAGKAPDFTAVNLAGQPVQMSALDGKVRVVTWYYTHCEDQCPLTMYRLEQLQQKLKQEGKFGSEVVLIAITLDPKHDTHAVIATYSTHYHADHKGWYFLRAAPAQTAQILQAYGVQEKQSADSEAIEHTLKTELIDQDGNVRKTYDTANLNPDQMLSDINSLLSRNSWLRSVTQS